MTTKPERIIVTESSGNVFADLDIPDAEYEKLRSGLLAEIRGWVDGSGLPLAEAAVAMGVKQQTLNDAIKGQYKKFTIDQLVRMLACVGKRISLTVTDETA